MSPPRGPATQALVAAVLGLAAAVALGRGCEIGTARTDLGPAVQVLPAIRAWDAGARRDR